MGGVELLPPGRDCKAQPRAKGKKSGGCFRGRAERGVVFYRYVSFMGGKRSTGMFYATTTFPHGFTPPSPTAVQGESPLSSEEGSL